MKKDLILITAYVPDEKRQQMLRNLVYNINKDNFDIMVSSHTLIPQDIFEKLDYFVYEKKNDIDYSFKNKFYFYFSNEDFTITSTEPKKYNHFIPVIRHISSGLLYAKNLGYEIVHYFEYDSLIRSDSELIENSKLLENYSAVYYELDHLDYPNSPISLNLNKISSKWFELNPHDYEKFLREENSSKLVEEYEWKLLNQTDSLYKKKSETLKLNNIDVALNHDLEDNKWVVPVYYAQNNSFFIFSWVENHDDVNSEVVVILNDEKTFKINRTMFGVWDLIDLGSIDDIKKIKILVNNSIRRDYDFDKIDINEFIKYNFIKNNF